MKGIMTVAKWNFIQKYADLTLTKYLEDPTPITKAICEAAQRKCEDALLELQPKQQCERPSVPHKLCPYCGTFFVGLRLWEGLGWSESRPIEFCPNCASRLTSLYIGTEKLEELE
jgi:hypothetical protein